MPPKKIRNITRGGEQSDGAPPNHQEKVKKPVGRPPNAIVLKLEWLWCRFDIPKDHGKVDRFIEEWYGDKYATATYAYCHEYAPKSNKSHYHLYIYGDEEQFRERLKEVFKVKGATQLCVKSTYKPPKDNVAEGDDEPVKVQEPSEAVVVMSYLQKDGDFKIVGVPEEVVKKGADLARYYEKQKCHFWRMCAKVEEWGKLVDGSHRSCDAASLTKIAAEYCIDSKGQFTYSQVLNYGEALDIKYGRRESVLQLIEAKRQRRAE